MGRKKHGTGLGYRVVEIDESTKLNQQTPAMVQSVYLYLEQMRLSKFKNLKLETFANIICRARMSQ